MVYLAFCSNLELLHLEPAFLRSILEKVPQFLRRALWAEETED